METRQSSRGRLGRSRNAKTAHEFKKFQPNRRTDQQKQGAERDELSYVLFWISMAQAQRMIDDSNVQMPNVRAWRPFTEKKMEKSGMLEFRKWKKISKYSYLYFPYGSLEENTRR